MSNDSDNRLPLYAQVESVIIGRISNGSLPPGTRLPSADSLVEECAVSRTTIRAAIQSLVQRGLSPSMGLTTFLTMTRFGVSNGLVALATTRACRATPESPSA